MRIEARRDHQQVRGEMPRARGERVRPGRAEGRAIRAGRQRRVEDVADAALVRVAGARIQRPLVAARVEQRSASCLEAGLAAVAVVHVEIDDRDALPRRARPGRGARRWRRSRRGRSPSAAPARQWWPGGRVAQKARRTSPFITASTPATAAPAARSAASALPWPSPCRRRAARSHPGRGGSTGWRPRSSRGCTRQSCSTVASGAWSRIRSANSSRVQRLQHGAQAVRAFRVELRPCRGRGRRGG